jgi:hypothetical protein
VLQLLICASLRTTLCLEYPTQTVVAAALTLAARRQEAPLKLAAEPPPAPDDEWYRGFSIHRADVEDAIGQILALYASAPMHALPPSE